MTKKPQAEEKEQDAPDEEAVPFEKLLERLSQVADGLEKSEVPLEKALALYEEGVGLARRAEARLREAESRIEELTDKGGTRPLEERTDTKKR